MTSKVHPGNFFEDFTIGMTFRHATPRTLTEGDRSLYIGLTGTRGVLGTAQTNATTLGLERRPMDDLLVFNTAFGKTVADISLQARGNLGYADVRFLDHVYDGDTLSVESSVIGLKENSNGETGVVYVRSTARNQAGREVLTWIRWVMIAKKDPGTPCPIAVVPDLPASVATEALAGKVFGPGVKAIADLTNRSTWWDDYEPGERLDHILGVTLYQSDHSIATRLYQNNARGHFDGVLMNGRPLIYGGHIMSVASAIAYDGLENSLGLLAINGGTHVAPTFSGDTIRCATQVLERLDYGDPNVGALRLRTVVAKAIDSAHQIAFPDRSGGRARHDESVVLDLDYTLAFPKRPAG